MKTKLLLTVILLLGAFTHVRADDVKAAVPPELAWVPPDSTGFVHIRFHDLWSSAVGKNIMKIATAMEPKMIQEIERDYGLALSRIDTVTVLLPAIHEHAREPGFVIRVTTTRPYDRRDVLSAMKVQPTRDDEAALQGGLLPLPNRGLIHFGDEKTITFLPNQDAAMAMLGRLLGAQKTGALGPALRLAAAKQQLVAAINMSQVPRIPAEQFPPELRAMRPLLDAKSVTIVGNMAEQNADVDLRFTFANKEDATEARQGLDDGLKVIDGFLDESVKKLGQRAKEEALQLTLIKEIKQALKTAKLEQTDAELRVQIQLRTAEPIAQLLLNGTEAIRVNAARTQSQNNLKQIGLAFHNYHDTFGTLPAAAICDKNGKPLLSWRVAILPFIEQDNLYKQFHLDEPWDSEHNIKLAKIRIKVYTLPVAKDKDDAMPLTHYLALVGNNAGFELKRGLKLPADFPDGTSNTIWIVEAADGVPWTKPDDIAYDPSKMPKLGSHFGSRVNCAFVDGSVRALKRTLDEKVWHNLIQRNDGNVIPNLDD